MRRLMLESVLRPPKPCPFVRERTEGSYYVDVVGPPPGQHIPSAIA